ncbi:MAG TPA: Sua5 family C-terminal domain-containing protein [Petrotogaceae bacterium]|jgi:L-threonylcarbamoyladenylate synthase|nr:Sua5 family C-terminal domain-containing protein [Petrotogaceae bacterium]
MFRKYEKSHDAIIIEGVPDKAIGIAIMNRLRKAASKII